MFKNILLSYDNTVLGDAQECAEAIGTNPSYIYKCIKESNISPDEYYRKRGAKGKNKKLYNLEKMREAYSAWRQNGNRDSDYVSSYDREVYATLDEYAPTAGFTKSKLYTIVVKAEPEVPVKMKYREGNKGRGSNVYLITDLDRVVRDYMNREPMYPTTYDENTYMTVDDVVSAFPAELNINKAHMTGFFAVFGIEPVSKYRKEGGRGRPSNLYDRDQVLGAISKTQE